MLAVPRAPEDAQPGGVAPAIDGEKAGCADGGNAWKRGNFLADEAVERDPLRLFGVSGFGRGDHHRGDVIGPHAGIYVEQTGETFTEQAGDDEQDDGGGELENDELRAEPPPGAAS